jgi:poly-gamma-glutamate synthesis protein (capsule biosynthesis protein)
VTVITLFICGDVMTGRGIDQILPHPSAPHIYEPYLRDARRYVELAERVNGPIPIPADFAYVWGDALVVLERMAPDLRLINLETSITTSNDYWQGKGINYRMHPANIPTLGTARIDVCALANNHVLDWGYAGLAETLRTLHEADISSAGAGRDLAEAAEPAVMEVSGKGRVLVFSFGAESSGIPACWAAGADRPGVNLLPDLSAETLRPLQGRIRAMKRSGDLVVASLHWGGNWGYEIPRQQQEFAHRLVDWADVDIVHGHSSHHVKGIEVYRGKPIIYGCGDFINDYEGIGGNEQYRGELSLMYFVRMEPVTGTLSALTMVPTRMKQFRIQRASQAETEWLRATLEWEGKKFGTRVELAADATLSLRWD